MTVFFIVILSLCVLLAESCISFICINSCAPSTLASKGYKLIFLNNRDENVKRRTKSAEFWTADQNDHDPRVYGPLDIEEGISSGVYSTWLGINEYGNVGNLLFLMNKNSNQDRKSRGSIVPDYLFHNSFYYIAENFLNDFEKKRFTYKDFNLVMLEMSPTNGYYSLYYLNNVDNTSFVKLNELNHAQFIFSISNSRLEHSFRKVIEGEKLFKGFINDYAINLINKQELIDSLFKDILFNKKTLYPDENIAKYMDLNESSKVVIENASSINAKYSSYWPNARTRTSTLILVDYNNKVEYFEFNLTFQKTDELWKSKNETFQLRSMLSENTVRNILFEFVSVKILFLNVLFKRYQSSFN